MNYFYKVTHNNDKLGKGSCIIGRDDYLSLINSDIENFYITFKNDSGQYENVDYEGISQFVKELKFKEYTDHEMHAYSEFVEELVPLIPIFKGEEPCEGPYLEEGTGAFVSEALDAIARDNFCSSYRFSESISEIEDHFLSIYENAQLALKKCKSLSIEDPSVREIIRILNVIKWESFENKEVDFPLKDNIKES